MSRGTIKKISLGKNTFSNLLSAEYRALLIPLLNSFDKTFRIENIKWPTSLNLSIGYKHAPVQSALEPYSAV
jgi:hypothetical protein